MSGMITWGHFSGEIQNSDRNLSRIREAFDYGARMHQGQVRKNSGLPYFIHPIRVALYLKDEDDDLIISGLLHDVVEDTDQTVKDIERKFGYRVSQLVKGVTKTDEVPMFEALATVLAEFPEVIKLRIADRIDNMSDKFVHMPENTKNRYLQETPRMLQIANELQDKGRIEASSLIQKLEVLHNQYI